MKAVVVALSVETIPIGVIVGAAFDRSLRRRPGRRGEQRVLVGLPASESVPRHVCGCYGCRPGERLSSAHLLGARTVSLADDRIRR
jgi:hypothetical protein